MMENLRNVLKQKNVSVIDVRSPWEYEEGHVKGSINIPLEEVPARLEEFKKLNGPIILYCRSGNRSGIAIQLLKQAGLTDLYNGGGIFDMQKLILN